MKFFPEIVSPTILPDTSLCAIVRDEIMNPAGGIERFVESHVPYVEQAVIADTGSVDGTREVLEELESRYPNLTVVDIPFKGYGDARNKSLEYVQTKRVLILDADELLTHKTPQNDWKVLSNILNKHDENNQVYSTKFLYIYPQETIHFEGGHTERIFDMSLKPKFPENVWEFLTVSELIFKNIFIPREVLEIKHFRPSLEDLRLKTENWYDHFVRSDGTDEIEPKNPDKSPSQCEGFSNWKAYNPRRDDYI